MRARELNAFDNIAGPFTPALGAFWRWSAWRVFSGGLRRAGIEPLSFADNNQQLWGKEVSGLLVLSPDEALKTYGETACFVVTIYQGSTVRRQLASLGCRRVAPFVSLFWKYPIFSFRKPESSCRTDLFSNVRQFEDATRSWRMRSRGANSASNCFGATGWTTLCFRRPSMRATRISH